MQIEWQFISLLSFSAILSLSAMSYENVARMRGWPISRLFSSGRPWLPALCLFVLALSIVAALISSPWWSVFIVIAAGFVLNPIFLSIFQSSSQAISLLGMAVSIPLFFWFFIDQAVN